MVLPNVALACNLAKSDSKSDLAVFRCSLQRSIQGFNHGLWVNEIMRCILLVVEVKLQITIVAHVFLFVHEIWDEFFEGLPRVERVDEGL